MLLSVASSLRPPPAEYERYKTLDSELLLRLWDGRRAAQPFELLGALSACIAWLAALPAVESFAAAMGGPVHMATGLLRSAWKIAAALSVMELTAEAGAASTADWVSTWSAVNEANHTHDGGFGPVQALEISYVMTHSRTLWLFAVDRLLLGAGFAAAASLAYSEHLPHRQQAYGRGWAHWSAFGALLCIGGFCLDVARFLSWRSVSTADAVCEVLTMALVLPVWLVQMARGLHGIRLGGGPYAGSVGPPEKAREVSMVSVGHGVA